MQEIVEDDFKANISPYKGGFDWLESRLPQETRFRPDVQEVVRDVARRSDYAPSPAYAGVVDLRKTDMKIEALLHVGKKYGSDHGHKLQLIGTSKRSFNDNLAIIERVVTSDPLKLSTMRTDFTVDISDIPMPWILQTASVEHKRFRAEMGEICKAPEGASEDEREAYAIMGSREAQSYYVGKRPNCFRFYNKTAERYHAYQGEMRSWYPPEPKFSKWMHNVKSKTGVAWRQFESVCYQRGLHPDIELGEAAASIEAMRPFFDKIHDVWVVKRALCAPKPSFEEWSGGLLRDSVLTRFERQIGADQIREIHRRGDKRKDPLFLTLADLRDNARDFNPYLPVSFGAGSDVVPPRGDLSYVDYLAAKGYRAEILLRGRQEVDAEFRRETFYKKGLLEKFARFVPGDGSGTTFTATQLYERYNDAISKQLAA